MLWHFTCHHTRRTLGDTGLLIPANDLTDRLPGWFWPGRYVWLTDLPNPARDTVGLSSDLIHCDRMAYRYQVTDEANVVPWALERHRHEATAYLIEETPGARPVHWYVATEPVPVVYQPQIGAGR